MTEVYVKFHNVEHVLRFIDTIEKFEDVDFNMGAGNRIVDAKSVIGVLALDLSKPQRLSFCSDDLEIMNKLAQYIAHCKVAGSSL